MYNHLGKLKQFLMMLNIHLNYNQAHPRLILVYTKKNENIFKKRLTDAHSSYINSQRLDLSGGSVVKSLPCNARDPTCHGAIKPVCLNY